jgi:hypothetical protein
MNPDIHMNPIPIIKRYSLSELSGIKLVNAIIKRIKQAIQVTGAKIQKSFVIGINI